MEEKEVLLKVEGLSKKFCKDLKTSLWYGVKDLFSNLTGNKEERRLRPKEFWALKDINFELRRGECLGLIGHNGAGKSTLLKILNGLITPDEGRVIIKGRVGALIELGAGFNPILTGRENIYNNGAVLGFTRKEVNEKLEEIIDFAEIREFIDMPVQHYSSGMRVRLGFAVAAQMEPDVLLIDEVLAVGDLGFALKCFKTIDKILPNTAIIFVSHNMPQVSRLCDRIILLEKGEPVYSGGEVAKGIDSYYSKFSDNERNVVFSDGSINLQDATLIGNVISHEGIDQLKWHDDFEIEFIFEAVSLKNIPEFRISIFDKEQRPIAVFRANDKNSRISWSGSKIAFILKHSNLQLSKGVYVINLQVTLNNGSNPLLRINDVLSFQILDDIEVWPPFLLKSAFYESDKLLK
ncbi:ABC transporter ATP-binding protein [Gramella sp. MT6]|uniref:ABC transporter ATP-binding protein n=1 Tax=Gramella sp. MT6 TaxID=2705471 RepID=UPI001C5ECA94|nr:ABC transporter ATP-binding protein [Gramella sp. MT6]QYA24029.1 ABC transporter ATP-binding protein [Gramella sp. MT6]